MQYYRPLAFFASCTYDMEGIVDVVESINDGVLKLSEEQFRPTSLKESGSLYREDLRDFGQWLLRTHEAGTTISLSMINKFLKKLVHRRMARFHVFCPGSAVDDKLRMSFPFTPTLRKFVAFRF